MFNQADPNDPANLTTLSLRDDPEPALQKAMQRAREEAYVKPFARLFGGIGLNPAAHRAVGSMEPSRVDGRRLMILGEAAVALGLIVVVSAIEWFDKGRHSHLAPGR